MKQLMIASAFMLCAATAQAVECRPAAPAHPIKHWSYRIIDGRQCWYEGNNMMSKSLLHWEATGSAQPDAVGAGVGTALRPAVEQEMGMAQTFESRWRGIFGSAGLQP
jgi:hypothetical protein